MTPRTSLHHRPTQNQQSAHLLELTERNLEQPENANLLKNTVKLVRPPLLVGAYVLKPTKAVPRPPLRIQEQFAAQTKPSDQAYF